MSMLSTRAWPRSLLATAPEPCAASVASMPCPAVAQMNRPVRDANRSARARALWRRVASPVRITAPVSTSSAETPVAANASSTMVPRASPSMVSPSAYGVSTTADSWTICLSTTA